MLVPPFLAMKSRAQDGGCAEAEERGHDVKDADDHHGPDDAMRAVLASGTV